MTLINKRYSPVSCAESPRAVGILRLASFIAPLSQVIYRYRTSAPFLRSEAPGCPFFLSRPIERVTASLLAPARACATCAS
jgi:hypothetical protein